MVDMKPTRIGPEGCSRKDFQVITSSFRMDICGLTALMAYRPLSFCGPSRSIPMVLPSAEKEWQLKQVCIRNEDVITWKSFLEQPSGPMRVGFMSTISPDGRYVATTVGVDQDLSRNYYVENFKD